MKTAIKMFCFFCYTVVPVTWGRDLGGVGGWQCCLRLGRQTASSVYVYKGPVADLRAQLATLQLLHTASELFILTAARQRASSPLPPSLGHHACVFWLANALTYFCCCCLSRSLSLSLSHTRTCAPTYVQTHSSFHVYHIPWGSSSGWKCVFEGGRKGGKKGSAFYFFLPQNVWGFNSETLEQYVYFNFITQVGRIVRK